MNALRKKDLLTLVACAVLFCCYAGIDDGRDHRTFLGTEYRSDLY